FLLLLWANDDAASSVLALDTFAFLTSLSRLPKTPRPKTDGFWEDIFPYLVDEDSDDENNPLHDLFKRHFRVTRTTFLYILNRLKTHQVYEQNPFHERMPVDKQVAIALCRLATGTSMRLLSLQFGVSEGTVSNIIDRFLQAMLEVFHGS